jgi:4-hydroxyphenylacetate 3-monooxygenase
MGARTGKEYLERLSRHSPEVWIGGERITDVTKHPATAPAARELARLYDLQHRDDVRDFMLFPSPTTGEPVSTQFLLPRTHEDLLKRRKMHKLWADATFGLMGRTTDFIGAMLTAWCASARFFGESADRVRAYFAYVRDNDLFLTHALADPPVDRSKPPHAQPDPFTYLGVVRETEDGLIVRGAKMLATAGPYADEILVWPFSLRRYTPEDARYAIAFAIPTDSPGLRFICREPYGGTDIFDHPLGSRFDEMRLHQPRLGAGESHLGDQFQCVHWSSDQYPAPFQAPVHCGARVPRYPNGADRSVPPRTGCDRRDHHVHRADEGCHRRE